MSLYSDCALQSDLNAIIFARVKYQESHTISVIPDIIPHLEEDQIAP